MTIHYAHEIINAQGKVIAKIVGDEVNEENTRLANLFTAAPELLAALEILTDHASEQYPHFESERGQADIAAARAAIAKAKGGE